MRKSLVIVAAVVLASLLLVLLATAPGHTAPTFKLSVFTAVLNGAQEVPPDASTAMGSALLTLDEPQAKLCVYVSSNVTGESAAHIHGTAFPGVDAAILFPLTTGNPKLDCFTLTKPQVKDLKAGLFYINIHTGAFSGGEIRGQILPAGKGFYFKVPD